MALRDLTGPCTTQRLHVAPDTTLPFAAGVVSTPHDSQGAPSRSLTVRGGS